MLILKNTRSFIGTVVTTDDAAVFNSASPCRDICRRETHERRLRSAIPLCHLTHPVSEPLPPRFGCPAPPCPRVTRPGSAPPVSNDVSVTPSPRAFPLSLLAAARPAAASGMASNAARGPRCRERSRRGRTGRGSVTTGRSRERESRDLPGETPPLGDVDALGRSEEGDEATKTQKKPARNQKQKSIPNDPNGPAPAETGAHGEPSRTSENGSVPPPKAPGKRGRKSKTEMLLLKLSQDLECPAPEPICVQKMLGSSEQASEGLETPPGGRPKRRAAKVALLYLQELAEELTSVYQPPAPTEGAQEPELARVQKKRQSRRRKEEETDSDDPAQDADFVPSKEVLLQAEEEEGSDAPLSEASEPELEALRGHGGKVASAGMGPSTSTLSARCSVSPRSRWALSRQGMPPSAASASASPGCHASPIITSQPVFMTALWPSGTCSPSPCCSACTSPTAPSSSTLSGASWPTTTRCGASSGARPIGSDRKIKFWDLRRLYEPINSIKRFLSTEVAWLLPYNGVTVAQDNCYASYGLCGIHYIDAGYLGFKAYFVAPRKGTVWSISGSDWLNTVAAGDITGELLAAVLPDLAVNPLNVKRSSDRRFPVYKADLLPGDGEPALPKTRHYREMVTKSYIRFRDTDLLQELPQPGAHAQDALAGGQGRAQPRPPAAGVPAQGAFQPQPGLARLAGVGRAGGHRAGALPGRAGLRHQPPAAPRVPCPLQLPLRGPARQPQPPREPPAAHRIAPGRGSSCCCHTHVPLAGARARGRLRQPGSGGAPWPLLVLLTPPRGRDVCSWPSLERSGRVSPWSGSGRILLRCLV
ncbi:general transcription factor 3C polypeptide 2 isoform X6 [Chroicocephalus ridibundus]|uniref:general transcription factor 3C polypeptide 2 isoform X6 n=1 Tax=Chroicocephalus ridibundus TaxID=1192867 RepID=UPI002FDD5438